MTLKAWLLTTWGRIRETLQPELFVLRNELRVTRELHAGDMNRARREIENAHRRAADLSERLAQRTRELKAARAKLKQVRK